MATVIEVMAKLSGNASGMMGAFKQASAAAESYRDRVGAATRDAVDGTGAEAKAKLAGTNSGGGFASGFKGAIAGLGVIAATVGLGSFVREAAAASDATDKFKATLNFAGLDTSAVDAATASAKAYADMTVYELSDIQRTMATLAANGVKDYTGIAEAAGNLNAVAGGNAETFKSVSLALGQSAGAGKLMAEDWNMLADAIPGASGELQKAMREAGAFEGNFKKAMESGEITAEEFQAAVVKLGNTPIASEAAKSTKTFEGALGNLSATINSGLMGALNMIKPAATGAISALSNGLGGAFTVTGDAVRGLYDLIVGGDFTGAMARAFKVEEDSKLVDFLFDVREGAMQLWAGLSMGGDVRAQFEGQLSGIVAFGAGAREAFDSVLNGAKGAFGEIGPALAPLGTALLGVLPSILLLAQSISPVGIAFGALLPVLPQLAGAAAGLATAVAGALAGALAVVAPVVVGIVAAVAEGVTWFMSLDGAAEALSAGIIALVVGLTAYKAVVGTISAVTKAWAAVQAVLNAVMAINPVTLIIIGIAALIAAIVLLVMNWDNVVNFMTTVWGGFVNWITGVMDGFVGWLSGIWSAIVAGVSSFASAVFTPIIDGFNTGLAFVVGIFTAIGAAITGAWTWVFNLLMAIGQAFWAEHGAQLTAAWTFIVGVFTGIVNFIVSVWQAIGAAIAGAWAWITGIISGALSAVWGVVSSVFGAVWGFISSIFNTIAGFIGGVWSRIAAVIGGAVSAVWGVISSGFNAVWGVVSSVFGSIANFIGGVWNGIINGARSIIGQVGSAFSGIWGAVTGALAGAGTWLLSAGKSIVQGLINGVQSLAGTIGNAFLSMVPGWIVGPFKAALGIASPSKLFTQFGKWIIKGLGNGVNSEESTATDAMTKAARAVEQAGSGITIDAPSIRVPELPNIAAQLALPALTQDVILNFVGTSPVEAIKNFDAQLKAGKGGLAGGDSYNALALGGGTTEVAPQQAPSVNMTVLVENPWGSGYLEAKVVEIAEDVTNDKLTKAGRAARGSRGSAGGGY